MMISDRGEWEPKWRALAMQFAPSRGRFHIDEKAKTDAIRRNSRPRQIPDESAAGLKSGLTSQSRKWFTLAPSNPELFQYESVKAYCNEATERLHDIMGRSNMYDEISSVYKEELIFGTGCLFVEEDPLEVFRCRSFTVGEYAIGQDDKQRVNRFTRILKYTAEDLVTDFGEQNVPEEVRMKLSFKQADNTIYEVRHLIEPNTEYVPNAPGQQGMEYRSLYWLPGHIEPEFLRIHGYNELPVMVPRWRLVGNDLYGSEQPGEMGIDDARTLQDIETDERRALKLSVIPSMMATGLLQKEKLDVRSGAVNYFDSDIHASNPAVYPTFQVNFDYKGAAEKIMRLVADLEKTFYVDLFRMWASDMRQGRTATEIEAREQEKMYALEPVLNRLMYDFLDHLVTRMYNIAYRAGLLPEMPPEMDGQGYKIEYTSVLARLQKLSLQGGLDTLIAVASNLAQLQAAGGQRPEVLDKIDFDTIIDQYAEMYAIIGAVYGDDEAEKIRESRREAEQQQQMQAAAMQATEAAPQLAGAVKDLSQSPYGGGTALDMLSGAMPEQNVGGSLF
jgi:hypothetical protein